MLTTPAGPAGSLFLYRAEGRPLKVGVNQSRGYPSFFLHDLEAVWCSDQRKQHADEWDEQ